MREILFKAKRLDDGQWVFGDLLKTKYEKIVYICYKDSVWKCDGETVCQYTGLKDKNGTKIFEGDIIFQNNAKETVSFDTSLRIPCFTTGIGFGSSTPKHPFKITKRCIVIGNIYDI